MLKQEQNTEFYQELDKNRENWNALQLKKTLIIASFFFAMIACLAWLIWQIFVLKGEDPNFPLRYVQMYTGLALFIVLCAFSLFLIKKGEKKSDERYDQIMQQYQNC